MPRFAEQLSEDLAQIALAVCKRYLSKGAQIQNYWVVGNIRNEEGNSLWVRLSQVGTKKAGQWTDEATGQHGDLLDLIQLRRGYSFQEAVAEARAFLSQPQDDPAKTETAQPRKYAPAGSPVAARKLFKSGRPIFRTLVETYLNGRAIRMPRDCSSLRYHPRCYYRFDADSPTETWPAMLGAATDTNGTLTGLQRTWLDRSGLTKAPIAIQCRAMGDILGSGIRFGQARDTVVAGEGIETVLSVLTPLPSLPGIAATTANHLAAVVFSPGLRRLYIAQDLGQAGMIARERLTERASEVGIETLPLVPQVDDWNEDLKTLGEAAVRKALIAQLHPDDRDRFLLG